MQLRESAQADKDTAETFGLQEFPELGSGYGVDMADGEKEGRIRGQEVGNWRNMRVEKSMTPTWYFAKCARKTQRTQSQSSPLVRSVVEK